MLQGILEVEAPQDTLPHQNHILSTICGPPLVQIGASTAVGRVLRERKSRLKAGTRFVNFSG